VGNTTDRTVSRVSADGTLGGTVAIGVYPSDIVVGPRSVYVATGPTGELVEIDPEATTASAPSPAGDDCGGVQQSIALGSGSLWLACDLKASAVRIPLAGRRVVPIVDRAGLLTSTSPDLAPHFTGIASGGGVTWIVDRGRDRLLAVTAARNALEPNPIAVGADPAAVALGFGSIWVANNGDGTVSRIQLGASGEPARVRTISVGEDPVDIATGEGGVWVANAGSHTVSRIDPATNSVTRTIDLHNPPAGIAVGEGRIWVTVAKSD
jgi:YVTN family beta-propeller protein